MVWMTLRGGLDKGDAISLLPFLGAFLAVFLAWRLVFVLSSHSSSGFWTSAGSLGSKLSCLVPKSCFQLEFLSFFFSALLPHGGRILDGQFR